MQPTELDSLWFHNNPDRQFRLRAQTPPEIAEWPVPPVPGETAWCIIRRSDGAAEAFGLPEGDTWDDSDEEIEPFFDELHAASPDPGAR